MINVDKKTDCCGCGACVQKCPKECILLQEDSEGFSYPVVDQTLCVNCGLCSKVCGITSPYTEQKPLQVLGAQNWDAEIVKASSSGGVFTSIALNILAKGGVVFGARFDESYNVIIDYIDNAKDLSIFRGSKYVQAKVGNAYIQAEHFLKSGRFVLFTGTPCMISGLLHYLRKPYKKLLTCDFVCHGVPSPKVWNLYISQLQNKYEYMLEYPKFRNKANGWKKFNFSYTAIYKNNKIEVYSSHQDNIYMKAFLGDLILRPSCYDCKFKLGKSHSDVTLADFWGVDKLYPDKDDNRGIGLVMINSRKGFEIINDIDINSWLVDYSEVIRYNSAFIKSPKLHPKRTSFFENLNMANPADVETLLEKYVYPNILIRIKYVIKSQIKHFFEMVTNGRKSRFSDGLGGLTLKD